MRFQDALSALRVRTLSAHKAQELGPKFAELSAREQRINAAFMQRLCCALLLSRSGRQQVGASGFSLGARLTLSARPALRRAEGQPCSSLVGHTRHRLTSGRAAEHLRAAICGDTWPRGVWTRPRRTRDSRGEEIDRQFPVRVGASSPNCVLLAQAARWAQRRAAMCREFGRFASGTLGTH